MNTEYKVKITGDVTSLEKIIKQASGSVQKLTDKDYVIKLDYDGNVQELRKTLDDAVKACPELAIQFEYDVNKKALEQKMDELKKIEAFKLDVDTNKVNAKIRDMASDIQNAFTQGVSKDTLKNKVTDLYKYINTATKAGIRVSRSFESLQEVDDFLDGFISKTNFARNPLTLFEVDGDLEDSLERINGDIEKINKALEYFRSKGAVDKTVGESMQEEAQDADKFSEKLKELQGQFEDYFNKKKGVNPGNFWSLLKQKLDDGDESAKELLKDLKLINEQGSISQIAGGRNNDGGIIGSDTVLIARKNRADKDGNLPYEETMALKRALDEAYNSGINVARIIDVIGDEGSATFLELQEKASGLMLGSYNDNILDSEPTVNPEFLEATDEQIKKLISDILALKKAGVGLDLNVENILYDKAKGFQLIDLNLDPKVLQVANKLSDEDFLQDALYGTAGAIELFYEDLNDPAGVAAAQAFGQRFEQLASVVMSASQGMVETAEKATADAQDSHSPSRVAEELGKLWPEGYAKGIIENKDVVEDAIRELINTGKLTMADLLKDQKNILSEEQFAPLIDPIKNIVLSMSGVANAVPTVSPSQTFDNEVQKNLTYLENYKNTIKEIDRLKLEPETDETKKKLEELNDLAKYFVSNITSIRSENGHEISPEMMKFGFSWADNLAKMYTGDQLNELYKVAHDNAGLAVDQVTSEYSHITEELKNIEAQSESTRQSLAKDLVSSRKYANNLADNLHDLVEMREELSRPSLLKRDRDVYEKDVARISEKYPEILELADKLKTWDSALKFTKSDEWNDFLATLPQAHAYLESIGYDFEKVNEQASEAKPQELFEDKSGQLAFVENLVEAESKLESELDEVSSKAKEASEQIEGQLNLEFPDEPEIFEDKSGQLSFVEKLTESEKELGDALEEVASDAKEANEQIEGQMTLDFSKTTDQEKETVSALSKVSDVAKETATATTEAAEGIKAEGEAAKESAKKKDDFTKANKKAAKSGEDTSKSSKEAADGISKEGVAAEKSAKQKDKFTKANKETAKEAEKATSSVKEESKAFKENADLSKWLKDIQGGTNTIEFGIAIDKEMAEAELKRIAPHLAEEFNKQYGTDISASQVVKAYKTAIKERQKAVEELAKAEEKAAEATRKKQEELYIALKSGSAQRQSDTKTAEQKELNATLSKQVDLYKEILSIDKKKAKLDPTVESDAVELAALDERRVIAQKEFVEAKKQSVSLGATEEDNERILLQMQEARAKQQREMVEVTGHSQAQLVKEISNQQEKLNSMLNGKWTADYRETLKSALSEVDALMAQAPTMDLSKLREEWARVGEIVDEAIGEKGFSRNKAAAQSSLAKLSKQIEDIMAKNTAMGKDFQSRFENLRLRVDSAESNEEVEKLKANIVELEAELIRAGKAGRSFGDILKERIVGLNAQFLAQYFSWQDWIRYIRELSQNVIGIDTALTELRKVSDASAARLQQNFKKSSETALELGQSIEHVINVTADWARLGYDVDAAEELARVTALFTTVGDNMTADDASSYLISTLQGFHKAADEAESVIDVYNEVANNFAIDTAGKIYARYV